MLILKQKLLLVRLFIVFLLVHHQLLRGRHHVHRLSLLLFGCLTRVDPLQGVVLLLVALNLFLVMMELVRVLAVVLVEVVGLSTVKWWLLLEGQIGDSLIFIIQLGVACFSMMVHVFLQTFSLASYYRLFCGIGPRFF